jgi:hypothetical protein
MLLIDFILIYFLLFQICGATGLCLLFPLDVLHGFNWEDEIRVPGAFLNLDHQSPPQRGWRRVRPSAVGGTQRRYSLSPVLCIFLASHQYETVSLFLKWPNSSRFELHDDFNIHWGHLDVCEYDYVV